MKTTNKKLLNNILSAFSKNRKKAMSEAIKRGKAYARLQRHNLKTA